MIKRCIVSQPLFGTLFSSLLSIKGYKSNFGSVQQECHGYGYGDMLKMNAL